MEFHQHALRQLAVLVGHFVLAVGLAKERERRPIGPGRGLDHVRDVSLLRLGIEVRKVLAAAAMSRLAVLVLLDHQFAALADQLAFHVAPQVEIAAMGDALQLAELALGHEREGILDIGRAARIVAQLVGVMIAQPQPVAGQAQVEIPLIPTVAPIGIPIAGGVGVAEELDFHLLEFPRAEREVARRDLVAETLAHLADAERNLHAGAVQNVLEVDEHPLRGLGPEEGLVLFVVNGAGVRLEHQVELARLGQIAATIGTRHLQAGCCHLLGGDVLYQRGQGHHAAVPRLDCLGQP